MSDFTKATHTVSGTRVEFIEDIGHGDYPLIFDLYDRTKQTWFARGLFTREGEIALAIEGYDLAPPGPPPRNLYVSRRQARAMWDRANRHRPVCERLVETLLTQEQEMTT